MNIFKGIPVSAGISVGTVYVSIEDTLTHIPRYRISKERYQEELTRFEKAIAYASKEIKELIRYKTTSTSEQDILQTHIEMLQDREFKSTVAERLEKYSYNVEWIVHNYISELVEKLNIASQKGTYLRARTADFYDILKKILDHLLLRNTRSFHIPKESILFCQNLTPSELITLRDKRLKGIVLETGGAYSHTAILARALEVPCVMGIPEITICVEINDTVIIDGTAGEVILNPEEETIEFYKRKREKASEERSRRMDCVTLPSQTTDNIYIPLQANIEVPEEVGTAKEFGAEGIGLYRSEFLFMNRNEWPNEEQQYQAYVQVLETMGNAPVTIRTLDVGGSSLLPSVKEPNPILGWRAVRFSLANNEIFHTQLRALYRASMHGSLRILFPLVSVPEEIQKIKDTVRNVQKQLTKERKSYSKDVPLGIMIEVPSAAILSDVLAAQVDFFSIGTNDLVQYTMAVDRSNEYVAYLYDYFHPSILRLLRIIISHAHAAGIRVAMCGEMAGDPHAVALLLGMNIDELSVNYPALPTIKQIVRSLSRNESVRLAQQILAMNSINDIKKRLVEFSQKILHAS